MTTHPPDGAKGAVEVSDGVLMLRWGAGAVIGEKDAREAMAKITELCAGRDRPLLVEIRGIQWMDHGARRILASSWPLSRVAIIVSSPVDQVIVNFWQARHSPPYPTQVFSSSREAMGWLRGNVSPDETTAAVAAAQDEPE
ncbi:hypothetical protein ASG92_20430 [Arthrobacter sp. Soil736]|uniref:DUF7793 family protein n=1 Tax=Arthrobacter sp. Soil736 TaxID=1736395 RepID=UPI0006F382A7|nr:STAS/SEC14 domain-containing protein [Arthrobacter sp. Soil736]KRE61761.1 hypothetical protein ASG92_20430 [Arthrobacter sp. Soil736]